ncbi:MAG: hypothetical protein QOH45_324 [Pseudonocardiales bacterium]|nr:hypothetical protein [Pseudonocardiales bacterium]
MAALVDRSPTSARSSAGVPGTNTPTRCAQPVPHTELTAATAASSSAASLLTSCSAPGWPITSPPLTRTARQGPKSHGPRQVVRPTLSSAVSEARYQSAPRRR